MVTSLTYRYGLLLTLCCLLFTTVLHAQASKSYITLVLDAEEIFVGDAVVLEVESTGLLDPIDLSPLQSVATVVRETTGTRIAVIKGKVVEIAIRRIDLIPHNPGNIVIGPLLAGDVTSNSVYIKVLNETRPKWQPALEDMQIQTSLTPATPYVNQQTLFTIDLLHRYPISNEQIELPDFAGFTKRALIENRRTFSDEEKEWYRTRWQYLIFPSHSGTTSIGAINWTGTAAKSRIERADFTRSHKPLTISVKAAEREGAASSQWWLPADSLKLTEAWSSPVTELRAGDELLRTITITANGLLAGQIPTPNVPESRALQQTLVDTTRDEKASGNSINSTASFTYRVKAQSPIPVFLDTVRLAWWNTKLQQAAEAILPARRINVGLPDRADVLKKMALQDTDTNRFRHWLQSTGWLRAMIFLAAIVAMITLLVIFIPVMTRRFTLANRRRQLLKKIRSLANKNEAESLYSLLKERQSCDLLGGTDRQLLNHLQTRLYSTGETQDRYPPLTQLIQTIDLNKMQSEKPVPQHRNSTLARL